PTCDSGSSGCQPASTSNMSAVSATLRAIGPSTESGLNGCLDVRGTMPVIEQKLEGVRMLPPKSPPVASHTWPDASAAAEPPEEPLALMRKSHGLRVAPNTSLNVLPPAANSGRLVFPITTA